MSGAPSPNGGNGKRDHRGRFAKGNPGGPGNPYGQQVARLRAVILEAVTDDDLRKIVAALVKRAKGGDVVAARELLNRLVGIPVDVLADRRLQLCERRLELDEVRFEEDAWDKLDAAMVRD